MRDWQQDESQGSGLGSEPTLSAASLLGIFVALVLICGVFFGFGYSFGHRAIAGGTVPLRTDGNGEGMRAPVPSIAKPSAVRMLDSDGTAAEQGSPPAGSATLLEAGSPSAVTVPDVPAAGEAAAAATTRTLNNGTGARSTPTAPPPAAAQTVVQVAAVARRQDADILVSALRQRGYRATQRSEPGDKLLHVQVGPFLNLEQANAMKRKLLADGYNAIVMQ